MQEREVQSATSQERSNTHVMTGFGVVIKKTHFAPNIDCYRQLNSIHHLYHSFLTPQKYPGMHSTSSRTLFGCTLRTKPSLLSYHV